MRNCVLAVTNSDSRLLVTRMKYEPHFKVPQSQVVQYQDEKHLVDVVLGSKGLFLRPGANLNIDWLEMPEFRAIGGTDFYQVSVNQEDIDSNLPGMWMRWITYKERELLPDLELNLIKNLRKNQALTGFY